MQIHNDFKQGSDEWYNLRLGKITGSSFYKLLGSHATAEKYLYEKVSEIITKARTDGEEYKNIHMERGREWESTARDMYIINRFPEEINVKEVGLIQLNDYVVCSPDGLVNDDGMIEIKVPDSSNFLKLLLEIRAKGTNGIPFEHHCQMQFNLYVSKRKWCDYVLYNPKHAAIGKGVFIHRVMPDNAVQELIDKVIETTSKKINEYIERYNNIMNIND